MNTHIMNLHPDALMLIMSGTKTIEMRLYDKKRQQVSVDDYVIFVSTENSYDEIASPSDMWQYYSEDNIIKYGVVGIKVDVVE